MNKIGFVLTGKGGEVGMKVAEFEKCFIGIPMKDGETREEIEDRFISALESVNEDCVATYTLKITEYDD